MNTVILPYLLYQSALDTCVLKYRKILFILLTLYLTKFNFFF